MVEIAVFMIDFFWSLSTSPSSNQECIDMPISLHRPPPTPLGALASLPWHWNGATCLQLYLWSSQVRSSSFACHLPHFDMLNQKREKDSRLNKSFDFSMAHMIKINLLIVDIGSYPRVSTFAGWSCWKTWKWLICIMYTHIPFPHTHLLLLQRPPPYSTPPGVEWDHALVLA